MQRPEPEERSTVNRVAILLFDGVELLDFAGPFEVFSAARPSPDSQNRLMEVFTVAEQDDPIICRNGLVVLPSYSLDSCPQADILVIPGGQGTRTANHNKRLMAWIHQRSEKVSLITSAGISAGIDMALHTLDRIYGPDIAAATARGIEYDHWQS